MRALFPALLAALFAQALSKTQSPRWTKEDVIRSDVADEPGEPLSETDFEMAEEFPEVPLEQMGIQSDGSADNPSNEAARSRKGINEGDIKLQENFRNLKEFTKESDSLTKNAIANKWRQWPRGEVPYVLSSQYSSYSRRTIAAAMKEYHKRTCIRFIPRDNSLHRDYIYIHPDDGCYSLVGRTGGRQSVSLDSGCIQKGTIIHELMHTVGFFHEQSRTDRDDYIRIVWDNVMSDAVDQFEKYSLRTITSLGEDYDYGSIMHYGPRAFSRNGRQTIIPISHTGDRLRVSMGQRDAFSDIDLRKINKLYRYCDLRTITSLGEDYDYGSIMHYGPRAFSRNGRQTIIPISRTGDRLRVSMGQRDAFSDIDLRKINKLYRYCDLRTITSLGEDYDYGSIMHYGPRAFSRNGRQTIIPISRTGDRLRVSMGQRDAFSDIDLRKINKLYRYCDLRTITSLGEDYDYGSIMHYGPRAFSRNGRQTIIPIYRTGDRLRVSMGQRDAFSDIDLRKINKLYRYCDLRTITSLGEDYDYGSIMHYGPRAFSRNGRQTIIPISRSGDRLRVSMGQRDAFSDIDLRKINKLYRYCDLRTITSLGEDYDYGSIMHYGPRAFSRNGRQTIIPISRTGDRLRVSMGQRDAFSDIDLRKINKLYRYCDLRTITSLGEDYDYGSIMHYGPRAFSRNGRQTIIPISRTGDRLRVSMGQRDAFSDIDLRKINKLYRYCDLRTITSLGEDYDYGSIMHYGPRSFSRNARGDRPSSPSPRTGDRLRVCMGQRDTFSYIDLRKINKLYRYTATSF